MEPILSVPNPIADVEIIEIFEGIYDDWGFLHYPVKIDGLELTFYQDRENQWIYEEKAILPVDIRCMVSGFIGKIR